MKVLIVVHGNDAVYGAANSMKMLLRNCDWDFDLIYKKYFHQSDNATDKRMLDYTASKAGYVKGLFLPFIYKSVCDDVSFRVQFVYQGYRPLILIDSFKLRAIIKKGNYDYIILNSLVLYPLVGNDGKYIVYVREMCRARGWRKKRIVDKLNQANKLIYIDPSLKRPFTDVKTDSCVINNPFDMRELAKIDLKDAEEKYPQVDTNKIIVSIIGTISPEKGIDFVIGAFKKINRKDIQLLVVGGGTGQYERSCKQLANGQRDMVFLNEQRDMKYVYFITDYVIRADPFFVTGRTVYEGLYAGCGVIIQSDSEGDSELFQEYESFKDKIYFYKTRNENALVNVIDNLPGHKIVDRQYKSNISEYIKKINNFLNR